MFLDGCLNCFAKWRLWIQPLAILIYALAALVFVPLFLVKSIQNGFNRRDQEILIAGIFAWIAIPLSLWEIILHVIHYNQPKLQKHIIRILWMVPIYAINAWIGLIYPENSIYMDCARECYEAYVIYNFMKFLLNYLNMEMDLEMSLELKQQVKHIFPLCCLPDWEMGREFIHICKHGILQYTVVRPITTAIAFICKMNDVYGDGEFKGNMAFPYVLVVNNISQFVAMYCLVMFYRASLAELKPMRPLPKFLCIKAVVFFSFFQGVLIALLVYCNLIPNPDNKTDDHGSISARLQNFLICIEMCLAAIAHRYSFSYKPYLRSGYDSQSWITAFLAMWDISDVQRDITEHLGIVGSSISRRIRGRSMYTLAKGDDEWANLVTKPATSAPAGGLYQNDSDALLSYGTIEMDDNNEDYHVKNSIMTEPNIKT
ncbi:PREDICTED: transmembrane protein 184C [Nicrophorus vespilloides]|uniref:Transmembrane protein 184C n=1 Tax=Nicrophorus vespilloides TaxID=110193 RepID=A0ABM1M8A8_NICVS|nr:PREDICTED: transmembrane protein 184C [Nicrophorus vespilloides]